MMARANLLHFMELGRQGVKLPARITAVPDAPGIHAAAADGFRPAANEGT